jgi:hypothetical protein
MTFSNPWKKFPSALAMHGTLVRGDQHAPPTKWWNILWLILFGWTKVAVLRVETVPAEGWYIGFRDFAGKQQMRMVPIMQNEIRMRIGREDCTFFATTKDVTEIPLQCISVQEKFVPSTAPLL